MLDIEKLMREGKSLDEIGDLVSKELNAAQTKIDAEREAERIAAEKKARAAEEAKKASERKTDAREAAVAAFSTYIALVLGEEIPEDVIRTAMIELEQSIEVIKNLAVSMNGKDSKSIIDLLF